MRNRYDNNLTMRADAAVVANPSSGYGAITEIELDRPQAGGAAVSMSVGSQFSFLFSEYFKGILFVALCAFFIFVVPTFVAKPAVLRQMISRGLKRTFDIIGSIVGLILTLPLWIVLPVLIKLDSPGPVFYSQVRVGVDRRKRDRRYHQKTDAGEKRNRDRRRENNFGKLFRVIKFRTMVANAETRTGPVWATRGDARITRLGAILRKTRIDEIPQFINILIGDMSLVGPRPERPTFVKDLSEKVDQYSRRLEVKPGLTGLAQVESGYDSSVVTVAEKVKYDLEYIDNWTIWNDIRIILKTVIVVFTGKGAC
ncbi:MAG: sugar transferase [candidate division Zixibacteria bacterium]|nr:sugar transferase [candidate division Zixibacteria bacterium]